MSANNDDDKRQRAVRSAQKSLILHGALTLALGLAAGLPYTLVIFREHAGSWSAAEQEWLKTDWVGSWIPSLYHVRHSLACGRAPR